MFELQGIIKYGKSLSAWKISHSRIHRPIPKIGVLKWTIFLFDRIDGLVFLLPFNFCKDLLAVLFTDLQSIFFDVLRVTAAGGR